MEIINFKDIKQHPLSSGCNEILFFYQNRLFRSPFEHRVKRYYDLINAPIPLQKIKETNFVLEHPTQGKLKTFEHNFYPHLVSIAESSPSKRIEFIKTICKINIYLIKCGYVLNDVHENNIFNSVDGIVWLDWGSVTSLTSKEEAKEFNPATRGFSNTFYLANKYIYNLLGPKICHLKYDLNLASKANSPIKTIAGMNPRDIGTWQKLNDVVSNKKITPLSTHWSDVYSTHLSANNVAGSSKKGESATDLINKINYNTLTDVGCNKGYYTLYAAKKAKSSIGFDVDEKCIEIATKNIPNGSPVLFAKKDIREFLDFDINNIVPGVVFIDNKMKEFSESRYTSDLVLALAIVHHVGKFLPHTKFAEILANLSKKYILIEDIETQTIYQEVFEKRGFKLIERIDSFPSPRMISLYERK